jgi:hypothetical protein
MQKELFFGPCGSGFFSCCFIMFMNIIDYFNTYQQLPDKINNENMFSLYQLFENQDIYRHCFLNRDNLEIVFKENISFCKSNEEPQFSNYKLLLFELLEPFVQKYFSINETIQNRIKELKEKYKLEEQKDLCGIFYRGNDKVKETDDNKKSEQKQKPKKATEKAKKEDKKLLEQKNKILQIRNLY